MFCHNCGTELKEQAKFCPRCGAGVYDPVAQTAAEPAVPKENVVMGTVGACAGGLLGIAAFLFCCNIGIYPAFVGALMSAAVIIGYDLLGKQRSMAGTIVVSLLMVTVPCLGYLVNDALVILQDYEGLGLTLLDGIGLLFLYLAQGYINTGFFVQDLLALYGFAALGAVAAFWWSQRRNKRFGVG